MGSFRLAAGRGYLHPQYNFAESLVETARMLLCHSCRSELTRQGISLVFPNVFPRKTDFILVGNDSSAKRYHVSARYLRSSDARLSPSPEEHRGTCESPRSSSCGEDAS